MTTTLIEKVERRTFIELHSGVLPEHSNGCILIDALHDSRYNLKASDNALEYLLSTYPDGFELEIRQFTEADKWA